MPQISIRARLILLSALLLAILAALSAVLTSELARDSRSLAEEARLVTTVRNANTASKHFGDLRYWITDFAATQLMSSERNADAAKAQLDLDLKTIAPLDPGGVAAIAAEVDTLMALAAKAAAAYSSDDSASGTALMNEAKAHTLSVDGELGKIVDRLERQALSRRDAAMLDAKRAVSLSVVGGIIALALAFGLTAYIVRSINVPLKRLERSIAGITRGELGVPIPRASRDEFGAMTSALGMLRDGLIERERLERDRRLAEAKLRVTFDNMGDGVVMFDGERRLAAWNRNFQELLELPDAFLAERPSFGDYFRYLAERGEFGGSGVDAELRRYAEDVGRQWALERARPNGQVLEVRHNPVPGGGSVLIYSDITERKRAEEEIRAARDAAEAMLSELKATQASLLHAEKMASLGQLTAGIAHEIKNPLNFVNNFAGLSVQLLDELIATLGPAIRALGERKQAEVGELVGMLTGNLQKIVEHGRRADGIVRSMLLHSRGGSGERQSVELNGLVEEALNLAYHGARAQDQSFNITLEREFDAGIAPIELVPQDVTRVFLNLFGNAFYAAHKRQREVRDARFKPTLTVSTRDLGGAVEIRVRDNGTGIAPEVREKLFQPFFTTKPTGEGTGLGLSISYDIVTQQHGGTISVASEPGEFTEFTIRLPRTGTTGQAARAAVAN